MLYINSSHLISVIGLFSWLFIFYFVYLGLLPLDKYILEGMGSEKMSIGEIKCIVVNHLPGGKYKKQLYFALNLESRLNRLRYEGYLDRYLVISDWKQNPLSREPLINYCYKRTDKKPPSKKLEEVINYNLAPSPA